MSEKTERTKQWDDVYSIKGGKVKSVGYSKYYGHYIDIEDSDGFIAKYGHFPSQVGKKVGDVVEQGEFLHQMGSTGNSTSKHCHVSVHDKNNKEINPVDYIKDGGSLPTNTRPSGIYGQTYKYIDDNGDKNYYSHEGLDCSGNIYNVFPGWEYGLDAKEILDNYPEIYDETLAERNKMKKEYEREIKKLHNISDKYFLLPGLSDDEIAALKQNYIDSETIKIKNKYESKLEDYKKDQEKQTIAIGESIATQLRKREAQITNYIDSIKQSGSSKSHDEKYNILLRDKPNVFGNHVKVHEFEGSLNSQFRSGAINREYIDLMEENVKYIREKIIKTSEFYDLAISDDENLRKAIVGEISINEYLNFLAEQQRLAEQARIAAEEEARRAAEEAARVAAEEEARQQAETGGATNQPEQNDERDEASGGYDDSDDNRNDSTESPNASGTSNDETNEDQTETTTPISNDETDNESSTTTTTGDEQGSNAGGSSGSTGNNSDENSGDTDVGTSDGQDDREPPMIYIGGGQWVPMDEEPIYTCGLKPQLPEGFYVTRIAGLSSLNAAYEAAFEAGELDRNFFDEVSNLRTVQSVSLFERVES